MAPSKRQRIGALAALCVIAVFCQGGCGPSASRPGPIPTAWSRSRDGHVYLSRLLPEHPLYAQYQRLGQEIASLQAPSSVPLPPPVFLALGELFLPAPEPPQFPLPAFGEREKTWELTLLPPLPAAQTGLAPDLEAEVNWTQSQARQEADAQLRQVTSAEEERLAELRAEAVRARQESLNNAGLDLTLPERDAQAAAERERQRLWGAMEEELQAASAQSEARVTAARTRILKDYDDRVSAAQAEAQRRQKNRGEILVKSGSEMRSRMSKSMAPPEPLASVSGITWKPTAGGAPGGVLQPEVAALLQRDAQLREEQATLLSAKRAQVAVQMEDGVEWAVRRIAGVHGVRVTFPPQEPATGPDVTDELRSELRTMFQH